MELTTAQREAVFFGEGPLLIVAGAGTGKTLCLAHRVANLISSGRAKADEILVLTFSNKAAAEMEERIDLLLPYAFSDIWVSTFHSFGRRILRSHAIEAGIDPNFQVLTPEEMTIFLRDRLFELPLRRFRPAFNPTRHLRALVRLISRLKDEDVTPEDYEEYARSINAPSDDGALMQKKQDHTEMAAFYKTSQAMMTEAGYLDMADLVYFTLHFFRNNPLAADEYRKKFKYVLVDEFQDTNHAQYQLLKLMAAGRENITVVGDDDQSIYKFRGAAISNILSFMDDFPKARQVVLRRNFRSPQSILDSAYRLIKHNNPYRLEERNNIDKHLLGRDDPDAVLDYKVYDSVETQADAITKLIQRKSGEGCSYSDMAVLIRANKDADPIIKALNLADAPCRYSGASGLYTRPEVRTLISFLRILNRPDDSLSLYYLAGSEIYGMDAASLIRMNLYADRNSVTLEDVFRRHKQIDQLQTLPDKVKNVIKQITDDLDHFREQSLELNAGRLVYEFIHRTGYLHRLASRQVKKPEVKTKNIALFFDIISHYEAVARQPYSLPFINHLDDLIDAGDDPGAVVEEAEAEAVQILTIHKAKGLEFPIVVIAGIAEGNFPTRSRSEYPDVPEELVKERMISPEFHIQEERRLFYVAMTRSKKELYLMGARDFGGKRPRKISRFLIEALDRPVESIKTVKARPEDVISRFAPHPHVEEEDLLPAAGGLRLSYMHFDDYLTCPLKYKFVHVMRIPVLRHHLVIYGRAVREAVLDFLRRESEDVEVKEDDVIGVFKREWSREGFLSQEHEKMRMEEGVEALKSFYREFKDGIAGGDVIDRNYRFTLDDVVITGRWDMLRKEEQGAVIYDFRTSEAKDRKSANRKARSSVKNKVAVLAYYEIFKTPPLRLESHFVGSEAVGMLKPSEKLFKNTKADMRKAIKGVSAGDYTPDPELFKCGRCAYNEICPATAREL